MKLAVLGGVVAICAATAIVAAQAPASTEQTQTVIGCLRGDGTAQSPWVLAGVVIPPPAPANAGRGGGGGGAGRGAGRGDGRGAAGGGAPGAGGPGAGREGGAPGGAPGAGRAAAPPAAAPAPPPPPPAPIDLRLAGIDMTPWRGYRTQVEGTMELHDLITAGMTPSLQKALTDGLLQMKVNLAAEARVAGKAGGAAPPTAPHNGGVARRERHA